MKQMIDELKRMRENSWERENMKKMNLQIKYDCRDEKAYLTIGVIGMVTLMLCMVRFFCPQIQSLPEPLNDAIYLLSFLLILPGALLAIVGGYRFVRCRIYLRKLKKRGMTVPDRKEKYHHDLRELAAASEDGTAPAFGEKGMAKANVFFAGLGWYVIFRTVYRCWLLFSEYTFTTAEFFQSMFFSSLPLIPAVCWIFKVLRERDGERYRDETVPDTKRKNRMDYCFVLVVTILAAVLYQVYFDGIKSVVLHEEINREEFAVSALSTYEAAAKSAYLTCEVDETETYVITVTKQGVFVTGVNAGEKAAGTEKIKEEFLELSGITEGTFDWQFRRSAKYKHLKEIRITINCPEKTISTSVSFENENKYPAEEL